MTIICPICTEPLRPNVDFTFSVTSCGHSFHSQCIKQWIQRSQTCPQCRKACTKKDLHQLFLEMTDQGAQDVENNLKQKKKELKDQKIKYDTLNLKFRNTVSEYWWILRKSQTLLSDQNKSVKKIVDLENKLSEMNSCLITQNMNYKVVITAKSKMEKELKTLKASKVNFENTIMDLKNQLTLKIKAKEQMEKELKTVKASNANFETTIVDLKNQIQMNIKAKKQTEIELKTAKTFKVYYEQKIMDLNHKLSVKTSANDKMAEELKTVKASKDNLEKTIVDLKNQLSVKTMTNDQMEKDLKNLQKENENFHDIFRVQNAENSSMKLINEELSEKLEIMKGKCKEREKTVEILRREMKLMSYDWYNDYLESSRENLKKQQESTTFSGRKWMWSLLAAGSLAFLYKRFRS